MQRLALSITLLALALPATAAADAVSVTTADGGVTATLRADGTDQPGDRVLERIGRPVLEIARDGRTVRRASPVARCRPDCGEREGIAGASLYVRDLDGDGEPEVVVDRWMSGSVCCTGSTTVHRLDDGAYAAVRPKRMGSRYRLRDLDSDGVPELVSDDPRFFTRFAPRVFGSFLPIRVHRYRWGRFTEVTAEHPGAVRADRATLIDLLRRHEHRLDRGIRSRAENRGVVRSLLPALVADDRTLGERRTGRARLRRAVSRGDVSRRYVRRVSRFLRRAGY